LKSADELWKRDRIEETLITVPKNEPINRAFQEGLAKRKVDWFSGIEVSSVEMVQTYVANGYGIGVTVVVPKVKYHPQVRTLLLEGFEPATFGVLWQGGRNPLLDALFKLFQKAARELMEGEDPRLMLLK
jgi:DNA-binding transcriptional LysR family regulator